jgi:hypothetical protein
MSPAAVAKLHLAGNPPPEPAVTPPDPVPTDAMKQTLNGLDAMTKGKLKFELQELGYSLPLPDQLTRDKYDALDALLPELIKELVGDAAPTLELTPYRVWSPKRHGKRPSSTSPRCATGTATTTPIRGEATPGFPDLVLIRPPSVMFLELKRETGRLSPTQRDIVGALENCPGVEVHVARPSDWEQVCLWLLLAVGLRCETTRRRRHCAPCRPRSGAGRDASGDHGKPAGPYRPASAHPCGW